MEFKDSSQQHNFDIERELHWPSLSGTNSPHYYVDHTEDRQTMPSADLAVTSRVGGSPHPAVLCCRRDVASFAFSSREESRFGDFASFLPYEARRRSKITTTPLHYRSTYRTTKLSNLATQLGTIPRTRVQDID